MRYVVAVDDVVIPVTASSLKHRTLKLERSLPRTTLARVLVLGERELACVVIPRAKKMDGLDGGGSAEIKAELNGGHDDLFFDLI